MGCRLGQTLANFFLAQLEYQFMNTTLDSLPAHCWRYVDDT